jgi:hypothetical protein
MVPVNAPVFCEVPSPVWVWAEYESEGNATRYQLYDICATGISLNGFPSMPASIIVPNAVILLPGNLGPIKADLVVRHTFSVRSKSLLSVLKTGFSFLTYSSQREKKIYHYMLERFSERRLKETHAEKKPLSP